MKHHSTPGYTKIRKKYYRKKIFLGLLVFLPTILRSLLTLHVKTTMRWFSSDFAIKKDTENLVPTSLRYFYWHSYMIEKTNNAISNKQISHAHVQSIMLLVAVGIKTILDTCLLWQKEITQRPVKVEFHSITKP
jgi:hypothetical protein